AVLEIRAHDHAYGSVGRSRRRAARGESHGRAEAHRCAERKSPQQRAPDHLGTEPSTPSTYQLMDISCSCVSAVPSLSFIAPALSLRGPAKGSNFPSMMARFFSSNSRATSGGTDLLSGVST